MIVVRLIGGLGNQFFQYAVGRHLAEIRSAILKMDISGFETYRLHRYSLWPFNIQENFASLEEVTALTVRKQVIAGRVIRQILRRPPKPAPTHIQEKHFHFDPEILSLADGVYLEGYWQSERYFKDIDIGEIIRKEFTVKLPLAGKNLELAKQIQSTESVSLHIRRKDYISNKKTARVHGTRGLNYYHKSINKVAQMINNPHFFVFSDDPRWAIANLKIDYPITYVTHNDASTNYEDLRLMSQCKHHIIANSSFSWWGAWLCTTPGKVVIAPKKWFNEPGRDTSDLIPKGWDRI